jgi:hypothetical protein
MTTMSLKTLPTHKDWPTLVRAHRIQADAGFGKLLEQFWRLGKDQYDARLALLPKLQRLARELARSKDIAAAGPHAPKMLEQIALLCAEQRKEIERDRKAFAANGAHPVDVQFIVVDWNGKPLRNATGLVVFKSPGVPTVARKSRLAGSSLDVDGARLRASGTVHLHIQPDGNAAAIVGATDYTFEPGRSPVLKFKAVQHSEQYRARAKSIDEVSRKLGFKGSVGADWKVVKVGGEVSGEQVERGAREEEVEWHVKAGLPTFLDFRQI